MLLLNVGHGVPLVGSEGQGLALCHVKALGALLLEVFNELADGLCLVAGVAEEVVKHLLEGPLCPVIVFGVAGAHLAAPVEREAYLVELFAIAVNVGYGGNLGVLSCLYSILLGGQAVGVVSHGVQHVISVEALKACVYVAGNVS